MIIQPCDACSHRIQMYIINHMHTHTYTHKHTHTYTNTQTHTEPYIHTYTCKVNNAHLFMATQGVMCDMLTGEEHLFGSGDPDTPADHLSCTVEMADCSGATQCELLLDC